MPALDMDLIVWAPWPTVEHNRGVNPIIPARKIQGGARYNSKVLRRRIPRIDQLGFPGHGSTSDSRMNRSGQRVPLR
jgi:hypothetical protein